MTGVSEMKVDSRVQIIKVVCPSPEENPYLKPSVSSIFIRGACVFKVISNPREGLIVWFDSGERTRSEEVACLLLRVMKVEGFCSLHFLALERLPSGQFQRIGQGKLDLLLAEDWFKDIPPMEVEII